MLIRWKNKDKDKDKSDKNSNQKQGSGSKKKRKIGRDGEEEWNSDGKSGRGFSSDGGRSDNEGEVRGRTRSNRRDDPRRHTLGGDQQYFGMAVQGGPLSRTMDLEGQPCGYGKSSNAMLFDDDPGIMSEVETSSTGFRRGGKQRSSLPVVRTPSKTLERPLAELLQHHDPRYPCLLNMQGLVFLQYRNETKRALLPNEITSIDTVKALFVRSFPKQLTMEYLDSPNVKIYIHDSSKDMFYELEDLRSHLREIRDRSVLRLFESADVSGGLPMAGIGIAGGVGHFEDSSYFSEPEFDSEYQHQHIHKSKGSSSKAPYYMGSTTSLPRGTSLLRTYTPGSLPADRLKPLPSGAPPKPQRAYASGPTRPSDGQLRPADRFNPFQRPANPLYTVPDGYMSSPERGSRYEDPYYSQYGTRSGSITPVIDEEVSDTELLEDSYSLYGVKLPPGPGTARPPQRIPFVSPAATPAYDATRIRVENMERQLANLTGLVQKALTQPATHLTVPGRDGYRASDEFDKSSSASSTSLPDDTYLRTDSKAPKLGKSGCHKSVSFEKSVSFSDEPPDMNSPIQHSPQHADRDARLKPAPPPKPSALSPGYESRNIYRDLQLTPEMYNQLRTLQKKAKDLRAEVRNLRRMSQAQAHTVRETIRDTFIKIRAMLMAGGDQMWQAGTDQERIRLSRDEDLYKQEMLRLEKDLTELESTVEELRGNVINRKTRVNMSDVENMALILSKSSKTVADLKLRFPNLQDTMKSFLNSEMDKMVREETFLKEEPERLESALRRCKKLTGTLVTLKRLASVQEQRLPANPAADGRLSPTASETPPITPSSATQSKLPSSSRMGAIGSGGDSGSDCSQRPENALDALLDELQTFSKPPSMVNTQDTNPPAIPAKGIPPSSHHPHVSEIGRKGSMDSSTLLSNQNLTVSTATGSLRRLHSYPSGSDTDNSPPIQPIQRDVSKNKPPLPERNSDLSQQIAGKRVPPPPPPRTSSKSPLSSPTSPNIPPRSPAAGLQHIQNVQNMVDKPYQSQFEQATQSLGLSTLRRNVTSRGILKEKAQTLPRNIGSNLQTLQVSDSDAISASNSSSCESVNSQDGSKKSRKEELEQRHQELLKKQKALQEQYARLQQLQRGNNTAVVPPPPDQLLKKTGSESNLLQKMGLQLTTSQMTGSLTNLPNTMANVPNKNSSTNNTKNSEDAKLDNCNTTNKVYETEIL
ncbi:coiled-coil domain-containing protein AGAP005037 isoform X6 [Harmonia axyridis]|uniref:coiled-coil domain-containing protein AGAP005037 isoform X6 n=1 Tax=Harmonia axyridis TaxID=115357 RepID=UPI001E2795E7|nr:coiled-coil domain-containing protein AGAP005037 isoform X6 [Harmonia axyridis]